MESRFRARYREDRPGLLILAHRGDSSHAPENTLEAAQLGWEAGAEGWELDVRLTADGVPVVIHDESLTRTTNVAQVFQGDPRASSGFRVADFTAREIRSLDSGSWFLQPDGGFRSAAGFGTTATIPQADQDHFRSGKVRVPTLAEALDWTLNRDWLVNVEIKPTPEVRDRIGPAILEALRQSGLIDRVVVSSFDLEIVARLATIEPELATAALVDDPIDRPAPEWLATIGADALHTSYRAILEDQRANPSSPRFRDVPILVYTVNETGSSGRGGPLSKRRVLGLFTDDPGLFVPDSTIKSF